jgi:hypothetical protein
VDERAKWLVRGMGLTPRHPHHQPSTPSVTPAIRGLPLFVGQEEVPPTPRNRPDSLAEGSARASVLANGVPAVAAASVVAGANAATLDFSLASQPRNGAGGYWVPWVVKGDETMNQFNNPNEVSFPSAPRAHIDDDMMMIGYKTYVQFMMDWGRDKAVAGLRPTPLSLTAPDCPRRSESTAGGTFSFPPREQPMHSCRRAIIAGLQLIKTQNRATTNPAVADRVAIISFDFKNAGGVTVHPLDTNYNNAMLGVTTLQACRDEGYSTSTETGLIAARDLLKDSSQGGQGRPSANKVIILLTDGMPNDWSSSNGTLDAYPSSLPSAQSSNFYVPGSYWVNGPLMQTSLAKTDRWFSYPVGIGLGTDYDFMDRMARLAGTDKAGLSLRGSGNPAEYEQRLTDMLREIITNSRIRLVQ